MKITVKIDGMMCGMCESHVKDAIRKKIPDAKKVTASHSKGIASFELENAMPKTMIEHEVKSALDPTGYKVMSVSLEEEQESRKSKGLFGRR